MNKENKFIVTKEIQGAIQLGKLDREAPVFVETEEGLFIVDYQVDEKRPFITIDSILKCVPTGRMSGGYPLWESVECDMEPAVIYNDLIDTLIRGAFQGENIYAI